MSNESQQITENQKTINFLDKQSKGFRNLESYNNSKIGDLQVPFSTNDSKVALSDSDQKAYTRKIAVTGNEEGVPQEALDYLRTDQGLQDLIGEKILHLLNRTIGGK